MEIAFQVHIPRRELWQQLAICCLLLAAIIGSFALIVLLCPPVAIVAAGGALVCVMRTLQTYLKYHHQSINPDRLELSETHLTYFTQNKPTLLIPLHAVSATTYKHGLLLWSNQYTLLNPKFPISRFLRRSKTKGCDLFFEFFDPSVQARLQDIVQMEKPHYTRSVQHR
jgi:hypothetical protein